MKSIFVLCLILSLLVVGKSEPENDVGSGSGSGNGNDNGSSGCYISCLLNDCRKGVFQCAVCLGKCAVVGAESSYSSRSNRMDNHDFCKIGCTTSLCTKFALPNNQHSDEKEVKGCVSSCSQRCTDSMY
ncbi:hypothetical protein IC582_002510 [Cucumis melo]|uniref:Beta-hordothionin-like n=1 Tax=Cucumis melo TaxID=3656 RepID=A0A1S3CDB8_CUCME|nr:beta-hordothionin-like [Cucumis melo]